jgi:chorismate mutase
MTSRVCAGRVLTVLFVFLFAGCAAQPPAADVEKIDRLLTLIGQRLGYMSGVAHSKWYSGAPIEDLPREREIIDAIGAQAAGYGLDAALAQEFFRAQIEASKIVQTARFREWKASSPPPATGIPDLRRDIRPALDALTPALLSALAASRPALSAPGAAGLLETRIGSVLTGTAADAAAREQAVRPLRRIARGP